MGAVIISWILLLGVIYIPLFQEVFTGFESYYVTTVGDWGLILGFTLGLCFIAELFRYLFRTTWFKNQVAKFNLA